MVYGQDASYDLPAPLLYTPAKAFGHNSTSLAIAGLSLAIRRMLRTVRSSLVSDSSGKVNSYFHGGSHGVRSALYNYLVTLSQSREALTDLAKEYFHTKEARRRYHWMTVPMLVVAKHKMLYLYPANAQRPNNRDSYIIDVTDFGGTARLSITFNNTFCEVVSRMAVHRVELLPHLPDYGGDNLLSRHTAWRRSMALESARTHEM